MINKRTCLNSTTDMEAKTSDKIKILINPQMQLEATLISINSSNNSRIEGARNRRLKKRIRIRKIINNIGKIKMGNISNQTWQNLLDPIFTT
jgi:hypothetical protein